jgi:hypothetical protein
MYKSLEGFGKKCKRTECNGMQRNATECNGMQRKGLYIRFGKQSFEQNLIHLHVFYCPFEIYLTNKPGFCDNHIFKDTLKLKKVVF